MNILEHKGISRILPLTSKTSLSQDMWIKHPTISFDDYMTSDLAAIEYHRWLGKK